MSTPDASTADRWKENVRGEWSAAADAWRRWHPQHVVMSRGATEAILQESRLGPGMQVLDLASGSGEPALSISEAVGPLGHVTATDLVPEMLRVAEDNARDKGLTNLTFRQADAEALPFLDQTFDAAVCRFGVMFFPNVAEALGQIRRVLKPGGQATFIAWGPPELNPFFSRTVGVFMKHVESPAPEPGAPGPFKFAQPRSLSEELIRAGFQQVKEESRPISWPFPGPVEQAWEAIRELGAPFRRLIASLAPEQREGVIGEVLAAIGEYYDGSQVNFPAVIVVASGVVR